MTIAQIKKNMKHGDYNILQKLLKLSTESAARQKFLRGDKDAVQGMIKIQENRSIFCDLHADEDCSCHDDLKEAINQKADRNHSHDWNEITGKPTEFPPTHHSHNVRDIEGLDDVLHTIDDLRNLSNQKLDRDGSNATGSLASTINNNHNHVNKSVLDTITSSKVNDWDNAAGKAHNAVTLGSNATGLTITNQVLQFSNGYQLPTTIKVSEWDDAYLKRHTHGNKAVLDNLTQSVIDQSHAHSNKSVIDGITAQMVNNWNGSFANNHTHNNKSTLDGISSADVTNWDAAHANNHTHVNKVILDAITAAYTIAEKSKLATVQSNAQVNVNADWNATSGDAEILNKPSSFNPSSHNHAISDVTGLQSELDSKLETPHLNGFVQDVVYNSSLHTLTFYQRNEPNIVIDLPIEHLIKGVQLHGNDLVFTFEDGSNVTVPMNTLLVGVVKSVNGLAANSQGEVVLDITDIPGLQSTLIGKTNVDGGNLTNIANWQSVLGINTALNLNLQEVTSNGNSTTNNIFVPQVITSLSNLNTGVVPTDAGIRLWSGSGNSQYGIAVNSNAGGMDIMANQAGAGTIRFWSTGNNASPILSAVFNGLYATFSGTLGVETQINTGFHGNSSQWNQAYIETQNLNNNSLKGSTNSATVGNFNFAIGYDGIANFIQSHNSKELNINPLGNNVRVGQTFFTGATVTASGAGSKLIFDELENFGSILKISALGNLPIQLRNQGNVILQTDNDDVIINRRTTINGFIHQVGSSVNSDTTKILMQNNSGLTWVLSSGINNISENAFSIGVRTAGIFDWKIALYDDGLIESKIHGNSQNWYDGYLNSLNVNNKVDRSGDVMTGVLSMNNPSGDSYINYASGGQDANIGYNGTLFGAGGGIFHVINGGARMLIADNGHTAIGYGVYKSNYMLDVNGEFHNSSNIITDGRVYTATDGNSNEWNDTTLYALKYKGQQINNSDANALPNGIHFNTTGNGTGNINWVSQYGTMIQFPSTAGFSPRFFINHDGETTIRSEWQSVFRPDRKLWDNINLPDSAVNTIINFNPANYVQNWDVVGAIGFLSSDVNRPYFYHNTSGSFVELAPKDWVTNNFISGSQLNNYLPLSGGTLTGGGRINSEGTIYIQQATTLNATGLFWEDLANSARISGIGSLTDGDVVNSLYMGWGNSPWDQSTSFSVSDSFVRYKGQDLALASQIPTNNNQLSNGSGYITASALNGYASQSWVNSQGFLTSASLPNVSNATITYQGTGAITGGGSHTVNQSGNSTYNFDLTNQTKNEISLGVNAYNSLSSKQDTLVAGSGISIIGNTISATGSGGGGIVNIATDSSVMSGPTASQVPMYFNSHVAYGLPETDIANEFPGNLDIVVETGDTMRFYGSYDNVYTVTERTGGIVDLDIKANRAHIYNVVFQSSGSTGGTVRFDRGIYTGDQINITVPKGQQITIQSSVSIVSPYGNGGGFECQTHANLMWDPKVDAWILVSYD